MTRIILATLVYLLLCSAAYYAGAQVDGPTDCGIEGTDWYYECTTGEELDLTPMIQDEADDLISTLRN